MASKVTLQDIAKEAGVSVPTVSRVMNESPKVGVDVVRRVRQAAIKLGASIPSPSQKRAIAFLLGNRLITHPFHSQVMMGAEAYCSERDYSVIFVTLHYPLRSKIHQLPAPRLLESRGAVDGFIVAGVNSVNLINLVLNTGLPCSVYATTMIDKKIPEDCGCVWTDETAGAADMTRYLIGLGHEQIGWVGNSSYPWFRRRAQGYRSAMEEAGLEPRIISIESDDERQVGYVGMKTALNEMKSPALTAITTGNDRVAHGVYEALRDLGLLVGRDMSVAGFNDTLEAVILHPTLTTMRAFTEQTGRRLAEQVIARIEGNSAVPQSAIVPTQLIRRESCAPLTPSNKANR